VTGEVYLGAVFKSRGGTCTCAEKSRVGRGSWVAFGARVAVISETATAGDGA